MSAGSINPLDGTPSIHAIAKTRNAQVLVKPGTIELFFKLWETRATKACTEGGTLLDFCAGEWVFPMDENCEDNIWPLSGICAA